MKLRQQVQDSFDGFKRLRRAHSGVKVVGTRLIVTGTILSLMFLTPLMPNRVQISKVAVAYGLAILVFVALFHAVIEQRRFRLVATVMDIVAISLVVKLTGGLDSSWFLLYVFPIMSVARYLDLLWSFTVAVIASAGYTWASLRFASGIEPIGALVLRVSMLIMVAFTAAKLARTRYREEQTFAEMFEVVDRPIVTEEEFEETLASLLRGASKITKSDLSAIALLSGPEPSIYAQDARAEEETSDVLEIKDLMATHYGKVIERRRPLPLAKRGPGAWLGGLRSERTKGWSGRLVPLTIGGPPFAVLGVFSRASIHYRPDDILKLSRVATFVAILQKNAAVSRPLAEEAQRLRNLNEIIKEQRNKISRLKVDNDIRLRMLYDIGKLLEKELGLREILETIVRIVAERLRSEEAALFLVDERQKRLLKKAVAGPNKATTDRLAALEDSYWSGESLTGNVFANRQEQMINEVSPDVSHVPEYAASLPSKRIRHYLGAPLVIGDEVLGVIRVINRRSTTYAPREGLATLDDEGFEAADLALLTMTARLIAVAIQSAGFVEQKRYFENLVYQSPDPIIILDENKKIRHFNQACTDIWGLTEEDVIGQSPERFYKSPQHAREIAAAVRNGAGRTIRDYPAWIRDSEGKIIPIRLSATEYRSKSGKYAGSFGVFKDARREHDDRLQALKILSRSAHHDIKNDVTTIKWYFSDLERVARNDPEFHPVYEGIRDATTAALSKLQSLLMTAEPPPAKMTSIPIVQELESFATAMRGRFDSGEILFGFTSPDHDALVSADREQLRQVLANLLGNSIDAINANPARDTGRIDIAVELTENEAVLRWRDNGIGMSEEAASDAFTAFYTTKKEGNGLGLYINRTIVEGHGGEIAIQSAIGSGTCITISLPLIAASQFLQSRATVGANA